MQHIKDFYPSAAVLLTVIAAILAAPHARAQTASDRAAAQGLFEEGRSLVAGGQAELACPKFEESQRLDPAPGTQFNLADCYERIGRTASAWTLFLEVAAAMRAVDQPAREQAARQRAAALDPKLSRLVIQVHEQHRVEGIRISRNGSSVGSAQWGSAVPVDPGTHVVRVSAPGYVDREQRVDVAGGGATVTVDIPALEKAPSEQASVAPSTQASEKAPAGPPNADAGAGPWRITAYTLGGLGVVGLGAGAIFGARALSKQGESEDDCDGNACRTEAGQEAYRDAQSAGTAATIAFAAGGTALAAGAVLFFLDPDRSSERPVTAGVAPLHGGASIVAAGRW